VLRLKGQLADADADEFYVRWAHWFFADRTAGRAFPE
jgi:hypothetical protein